MSRRGLLTFDELKGRVAGEPSLQAATIRWSVLPDEPRGGAKAIVGTLDIGWVMIANREASAWHWSIGLLNEVWANGAVDGEAKTRAGAMAAFERRWHRFCLRAGVR